VIDRAGYTDRYAKKYDAESRWNPCKTAFSILVERAAKFAQRDGRTLSVFVERGDRDVDKWIRT
jgi:hypothetical protein